MQFCVLDVSRYFSAQLRSLHNNLSSTEKLCGRSHPAHQYPMPRDHPSLTPIESIVINKQSWKLGNVAIPRREQVLGFTGIGLTSACRYPLANTIVLFYYH